MNISAIKILLLACLAHNVLWAQPVNESRQIIDSFIVYQDWKNKDLWYYCPGNIKLKISANGKPELQLTSLRYTGQNLSGDRGEIRYRNIIQLTVSMQQYAVEDIRSLHKKLKLSPRGKLIPLPIKNLNAYIVAPIKDSEQSKKRLGSPAVNNSPGYEKGIFWTERSYILSLDNYDTQILDDQIKNGRLAISFSYSFESELIPDRLADLSLHGDSSLISNIGINVSEVNILDTVAVHMIVKSGTFGIYANLDQYPDIVQKVDINEQATPPAYAAVEIRCYDFVENLRPDLFFKIVELEAIGVNNEPVRTQVRFSQSQPDLNTVTARFEYAVKINKPLRFRTIETERKGEKTISSWTTLSEWKPMIDITQDVDKMEIERRTLDFEFVDAIDGDTITLTLRYLLDNKLMIENVICDDLLALNNKLVSVSITCDKGKAIQYQTIKKIQFHIN